MRTFYAWLWISSWLVIGISGCVRSSGQIQCLVLVEMMQPDFNAAT